MSACSDPTPSSPIPFGSLGLPQSLIKHLNRRQVTAAFPIQAATIPDALAGRDILGRAETGSGKTLAFGLPTLARLEGRRARRGHPLALVLVPTRELAMQVHDALEPYGRALDLRLKAVFGGAAIYRQIDALNRGVEILIATPGRLTDLIARRACRLDQVEIAVLDEADQMADLGFLPVVCELLDQVRPDGQRLLFSATLDSAVAELVTRYLADPVTHRIDPPAGSVPTMSHHVLVVNPQEKAPVTAQIAAREGRTLLFVRTQLGVDRVTEQLRAAGLAAGGLHGGMTQRARTRTLAEFREGTVTALVATDVAARGIHVDGIDLVVHVDPAADPKDYLHRAGRTARAGASGTVATLALPKQRDGVGRLLQAAGVDAEMVRVRPNDNALIRITGARPTPIQVADARPHRHRSADHGTAGRPERGHYGFDRGGFERGQHGDRQRSAGSGRRSTGSGQHRTSGPVRRRRQAPR
ncbi:MAG: DEAD/DEAH box helicase [Sporichthyaceae bacterium]|nr:DEAD/DEAH box helicase [Sporichthyaceae bacterium]